MTHGAVIRHPTEFGKVRRTYASVSSVWGTSDRDGVRGSFDDGDLRSHPPRRIRSSHDKYTTRRAWLWKELAGVGVPLLLPLGAAEAAREGPVGIPVCPLPPPLDSDDVVYPEAFLGQWTCRRKIFGVKGDKVQAELAWRALGGGGGFGGDPEEDGTVWYETEIYETRFLPIFADSARGAVSDQRTELYSRLVRRGRDVAVVWDAMSPNTISYEIEKRAIGRVDHTVLQRGVDTGAGRTFFAVDELVLISSGRKNINKSTSGVSVVPFEPQIVRVMKRYLFSDDARQLEAFEIVQSYRVRNGIFLIEKPTSTSRSRIQLVKIVE
eukprot:CAMPEP_0194295106 /NCGR_PEP_ID=MMETSP0169-20130528/52615_1 /TAXON_ID=218684 /ORGANISM="Corethron pennatum, Strain L29A3" /LENGTH=323 /DNA_ID=CAMNT_0039044207 /DNA_START=59 /DNA_END=1030 /DNA_ORIENTATION=-